MACCALVAASDALPPERSPQWHPLVTWQIVIPMLRQAADLLADDKPREADALLQTLETLPEPYGKLAGDTRKRITWTLEEPEGYPRDASLAKLCTQLKAPKAAARFYARAMGGHPAEVYFAALCQALVEAEADEEEFRAAAQLWKPDKAKDLAERSLRQVNEGRLARAKMEGVANGRLRPVQDLGRYPMSFDAVLRLVELLPRLRDPGHRLFAYRYVWNYLESDRPGRRAWEDKVVADLPKSSLSDRIRTQWAGPALEAAYARFKRGDVEGALADYQRISRDYPDCGAFGMAQFNVGSILQQQTKYDEAIAEYKKIFPSAVNDRDVGAHMMETNRNYRNKAAWQISRCSAAKGDHKAALDWALAARDKYPFSSWCGTCSAQEEERTANEIVRLMFAAGKIADAVKAAEKLIFEGTRIQPGNPNPDAGIVHEVVDYYVRQGRLPEFLKRLDEHGGEDTVGMEIAREYAERGRGSGFSLARLLLAWPLEEARGVGVAGPCVVEVSPVCALWECEVYGDPWPEEPTAPAQLVTLDDPARVAAPLVLNGLLLTWFAGLAGLALLGSAGRRWPRAGGRSAVRRR
jgi:tetratricopeptide (TPR) repeat protein